MAVNREELFGALTKKADSLDKPKETEQPKVVPSRSQIVGDLFGIAPKKLIS